MDYVRFFDAGSFYVEAAEGVGELFVVDAEDVEHRVARGRGGEWGFWRVWRQLCGRQSTAKADARRSSTSDVGSGMAALPEVAAPEPLPADWPKWARQTK